MNADPNQTPNLDTDQTLTPDQTPDQTPTPGSDFRSVDPLAELQQSLVGLEDLSASNAFEGYDPFAEDAMFNLQLDQPEPSGQSEQTESSRNNSDENMFGVPRHEGLSVAAQNSRFLKQLYDYRKTLLARPETYEEWANDPVGFNSVVLQGFLWTKQRDICNDLVKHRRLAVRSCHDVGKSAIAARVAAWWICAHPPEDVFVVTMAPTWRQVTAILWREINQLHARYGLIGRVTQKQWYINEQLVAFGTSPAGHDPTALQGIHARHVLVIMDEACGIEKPLWDAVDSLVANETSRILAIGNPDDPATQFHEVCRVGSGWQVIGISAFDSPNLTGEEIPEWLRPLLISTTWVEEKRKSWGENSPQWHSKVLGQFPKVGDDILFSDDSIRAAVARFPETRPSMPVEIGCDVARYGSNASIIIIREGKRIRIWKELHERSTMTVVGELVNCAKETGAQVIKVDDAGLGGGPVDRLKEIQKQEPHRLSSAVTIIGINAGQAPSKKKTSERFINLRAELYWNVRTLLNDGQIALEDDLELQKQLSYIKYEVDSRGRIGIETKEDMRKRGLPSPDKADALMLALAPADIFKQPDWVTAWNFKKHVNIPIFRR